MKDKQSERGRLPTLAELEAEVEVEAREYARRRLEERLQALAEEHGQVFPPGRAAAAGPGTAEPGVAEPVRAA